MRVVGIVATPEALYPKHACGDHARPFDAEGEDLAFEETARVGAEVPELVHFDSGLEAEDAFDVRVGVAVALEKPVAEKLVVKAGRTLQNLGMSTQG